MPSENDHYKYWAFISYSHRDEKWADWLFRSLETYRVPRRLVGRVTPAGRIPARLFPLFRDREELPVSADLGGNIRGALEQSRNLIVICSPHAAQSRWVNEEIRTFKALGRGDRIQALIVAGEPNAPDGSPQEECFAPALRFHVGADGQLTAERTEPIAADARAGKDGQTNARLKLLAGLLGIGFDELRQRERSRRRKRLAGVALLVAAVTAAGLGLWQYQAQRGEKRLEAQRDATVAEQAEERGRLALLAGSADVATEELEKAQAAMPERPSARLMLGAARRSSGQAVRVLEQEAGDVFDMVQSPDGRHMVTLSSSKIASLWDLPAGRLIRKLGELDDLKVGFSGDGSKLLVARHRHWAIHEVASGTEVLLPGGPGTEASFLGARGEVLWCQSAFGNGEQIPPSKFAVLAMADGQELRRFELGRGSAGGLQTDPGGRGALIGWFAPAPKPAGVPFWVGEPRLKWVELATGKLWADLPRHESGNLELSPDGERLLYRRTDGAFEVRSKSGVLWTTPTRQGTAEAHWSRGGKMVIVSSLGLTLVLDAGDGREKWKDLLGAPATDDNDSFAAAADQEGVVHVRNLATGEMVKVFADRIGWPASQTFPRDRHALFSPDGRALLLAGSGRKIKIWDWRQAEGESFQVGNLMGRLAGATFSPDGSLLALLTSEGGASVWEVASRRLRFEIEPPHPRGGFVTVAFSPDSRQLLSSCSAAVEGVTAKLWDVAEGKVFATLDDGVRTMAEGAMGGNQVRVGWSAGRLVTANFAHGAACLWDAASRAKLTELPLGPQTHELTPGFEGPHRLAFSARGNVMAAAGFDNVVRVFALPEGRLLTTLTHPSPKLASVELSVDGAFALTTDSDGHAVPWKVATRDHVAPLESSGRINEVHLNPDGRRAAAACSDGTVRVWDLDTGIFSLLLQDQAPPSDGTPTLGAPLAAGEHTGFLSVQFDPRGLWVAGLNDSGRLCVWDLSNGRQLLRWKLEPASRQARLSVAPDRIAVFGMAGGVRVFNLTPAEAVAKPDAGRR